MKKVNYIYFFILTTISVLIFFSLFKFLNINYLGFKFYYLKYFLLFVLLFIISFFFKKKKIFYIIYLFSLLLPIYSFEILLNIKSFENFVFDNRSRLEIYHQTELKDKSVTISGTNFIDDNTLDVLPLAGVSNIYTIFCNENGYFNNYVSDRYGFNNPDKNWNTKKKVNFLVGDSFVHGACVKEDFTRILNKKLDKIFLNLGMGGNGPLLNQATLQEYIKVKKPDSILYFHYEGNDFYNLNREKDHFLLKQYLDINFSQDLKNRQNEINLLLKNDISKRYYQKLLKSQKIEKISKIRNIIVLTKFRKYFFDKYFPSQKIENKTEALSRNNRYLIQLNDYRNISNRQKKSLTLMRDILENFKGMAKLHNFKLYFIYIPAYDRFKLSEQFPDKINSFDFLNKKKLLKIVERKEIPIIDLTNFIKVNNYKDLYPFGLSGHFNQKGHNLISDFIISKTNH
jgi:hypothetical protein